MYSDKMAKKGRAQPTSDSLCRFIPPHPAPPCPAPPRPACAPNEGLGEVWTRGTRGGRALAIAPVGRRGGTERDGAHGPHRGFIPMRAPSPPGRPAGRTDGQTRRRPFLKVRANERGGVTHRATTSLAAAASPPPPRSQSHRYVCRPPDEGEMPWLPPPPPLRRSA